jgi:hypothetical protein
MLKKLLVIFGVVVLFTCTVLFTDLGTPIRVWASELSQILAVVDAVDNFVDTEVASILADTDSIRAQKSYAVTTLPMTWPASIHGVIFNGTGSWKIDYLASRVTTANSGTATNLGYCLRAGTTITAISLLDAIASDAIGVTYTVVLDTIMAPVETAGLLPIWRPTINRDGKYWATTGGASPLGLGFELITPDTTWAIIDSCSASNTGKARHTIRATPLTAGATLTVGTGGT